MGWRDRMILGRLKKRLDANRSLDSLEFITWAVANWPQVLATKFAWMRKAPPPQVPAVRFLAKDTCLRLFLELYAIEKSRAARDRLADRDEAEIRRRMATGMTRNEAVIAIAKERVRAETNAELEARRAHLRRTWESLEWERAAIRKRMSTPATAPVAPPPRPRIDPSLWKDIEVDESKLIDLSQENLGAYEDGLPPPPPAPEYKPTPFEDPNFDSDAIMDMSRMNLGKWEDGLPPPPPPPEYKPTPFEDPDFDPDTIMDVSKLGLKRME